MFNCLGKRQTLVMSVEPIHTLNNVKIKCHPSVYNLLTMLSVFLGSLNLRVAIRSMQTYLEKIRQYR